MFVFAILFTFTFFFNYSIYSCGGVTTLLYQLTFQFEEERLEKAFHTLSEQRREILAMLFVEERTPKEIASQMDRSLQHVYKQRSQALKQLRQMLEKGGEENE